MQLKRFGPGLGDPVTAAGKVDAVLAETGDFARVQYRKVRPEFSAFGQTEWPLTEQVRFLSVAACDRRDNAVLALMGMIEQGQRWGLGTIGGTRFKGGWGPSPTGKYLLRQMGLIITPAGQCGRRSRGAVLRFDDRRHRGAQPDR